MQEILPFTLRLLADQRDIFIGSAVNHHALREDGAYRETLAREFNILTPENELKFGSLVQQPNDYHFSPADEIVDFAKANDMLVRGHTLVWHHQNPDWLIPENFTRKQALDLLYKHIFTVAGHFKGDIYAWDVVNEALLDDGSLRPSFWMKTIGADYLDYAFQWAHEADPDAMLIYNEYRADGISPKSDGVYRLLQEMQARNVPVDGVGLQMHIALVDTDDFALPAAPADLSANLKRLSDLGLDIHITELDVQVHHLSGTREELLAKQAGVYSEILSTALENPCLKAIITWGFSDRQSWIPYFTHTPDWPLPFDEYYQPKPAYRAICDALKRKP